MVAKIVKTVVVGFAVAVLAGLFVQATVVRHGEDTTCVQFGHLMSCWVR